MRADGGKKHHITSHHITSQIYTQKLSLNIIHQSSSEIDGSDSRKAVPFRFNPLENVLRIERDGGKPFPRDENEIKISREQHAISHEQTRFHAENTKIAISRSTRSTSRFHKNSRFFTLKSAISRENSRFHA